MAMEGNMRDSQNAEDTPIVSLRSLSEVPRGQTNLVNRDQCRPYCPISKTSHTEKLNPQLVRAPVHTNPPTGS